MIPALGSFFSTASLSGTSIEASQLQALSMIGHQAYFMGLVLRWTRFGEKGIFSILILTTRRDGLPNGMFH